MEMIDGINDADNISHCNDETDMVATNPSSVVATTVNTDDPKQPVLQWKTKKRTRRQRDDSHLLTQDILQSESILHDKNMDDHSNHVVDGNTIASPLIIPVAPDQNKWKQKQQPVISLPPNHSSDMNELAAIQALHNDTVNDRSIKNDTTVTGGSVTIPSHTNTFVSAGAAAKATLDEREVKQYQKDIDILPSALDETAEEYQRVPINEFGSALLRGMGWKDDTTDPSRSTSKNNDVMPRPHRLGLGAIPAMLPEPNKEEGGRRPRNVDQYQRDKRTQKQHDMYRIEREKKLAEDLQQTLQDGSIVHLIQRNDSDSETLPYQQKRARILKLVGVPGLNMVQVQLEQSGSSIVVKRNEIDGLVKRDELDKHPYHEKETTDDQPYRTKGDRQQSVFSSNERSNNNSSQDRIQHQNSDKKRSRHEKYGEKFTVSWVIPNIRVRIVSEKLGRRYYKEKGIVVDVTRNAGVTLKLNHHTSSSTNSNTPAVVLDRVPERYLETALPKIGGNVIVVDPKHANKFAKGRMIERDGKNKNFGIVQLYDDMDCIRLPLDDIAEWCGPLDDDMMT